MKRRNTKKTSKICAEHFKTRCCQRLGIVLDQEKLKKMMLSGELAFLHKQSNTRTHWKYEDQDIEKPVVLVYDKLRNVFITVLT